MSSAFQAAVKGDTYCRPAGRTDVVKFFLLNYGLHALTAISPPGSGSFTTFITGVTSILLPFSSIFRALSAIYRCATSESTSLERAVKAGALCMVLPSKDESGENLQQVWPALTSVHGQHPVPSVSFLHWRKHWTEAKENKNSETPYRLVRVPLNFSVKPMIKSEQECPTEVSCNYSILRAVAAIIQIIYGSFELYEASGVQFETYGYAAYSLTVIPYILMSLVNLIATICEPQYPSMYIAHYGGVLEGDGGGSGTVATSPQPEPGPEQGLAHNLAASISTDIAAEENQDQKSAYETLNQLGGGAEAHTSGVVGKVYGKMPKSGEMVWEINKPNTKNNIKGYCLFGLACLVGMCVIAAPYVIIQLLTGFNAYQSTRSQRTWMMVWLVLGQVFGPAAYLSQKISQTYNHPYNERTHAYSHLIMPLVCSLSSLIFSLILSAGSIGGFVVAGKMMREHQVCTTI